MPISGSTEQKGAPRTDTWRLSEAKVRQRLLGVVGVSQHQLQHVGESEPVGRGELVVDRERGRADLTQHDQGVVELPGVDHHRTPTVSAVLVRLIGLCVVGYAGRAPTGLGEWDWWWSSTAIGVTHSRLGETGLALRALGGAARLLREYADALGEAEALEALSGLMEQTGHAGREGVIRRWRQLLAPVDTIKAPHDAARQCAGRPTRATGQPGSRARHTKYPKE
jgi:hypothetical protein